MTGPTPPGTWSSSVTCSGPRGTSASTTSSSRRYRWILASHWYTILASDWLMSRLAESPRSSCGSPGMATLTWSLMTRDAGRSCAPPSPRWWTPSGNTSTWTSRSVSFKENKTKCFRLWLSDKKLKGAYLRHETHLRPQKMTIWLRALDKLAMDGWDGRTKFVTPWAPVKAIKVPWGFKAWGRL